MKYVIVFASLFISSMVFAQNPQEIAAIISKMQPNNGEMESLQIAQEVDTISHDESLDWKLVLSIFAQESTFQKDPQNCVAGLRLCKDFGIGQINYKTWGEYFGLDKKRLVTDYHYSIKSSVNILIYYRQRYGFSEKAWFLRYHSSTPGFRKAYGERISHQYARINKYLREIRDERNESTIGYNRRGLRYPYSFFGPSELLYAGTTPSFVRSGNRPSTQVFGTLQFESIIGGALRKRRALG